MASCTDNVKNGVETDIDCGGNCPRCSPGEACVLANDCTSRVCVAETCQTPNCLDGVKNGLETGIDCGGACPMTCVDGDNCEVGGDCASGVCVSNICQAPTCTDTVKNGSEPDIDCGGQYCAQCADGDNCNVGSDCTSGVCVNIVCQAATCMDGTKNGMETDLDCGGSVCQKCTVGKSCNIASDCQSNACINGTCVVAVTGKLVFLATGYNGNLGGVAGADAKCQQRASAAGLAGTFKAWISDGTMASSPSVRFTKSAEPYVLVGGTLIANNWNDLTDGTIANRIDKTEFGTAVNVVYQGVYTFTQANGTPGLFGSPASVCYGSNCHCDSWTNANAQGNPTPGSAVGYYTATNDDWTDYSFGNSCNGPVNLYCFQQ